MSGHKLKAAAVFIAGRQCGKSESLREAIELRADALQRALSMHDYTYEIQPGLDYLERPELSMLRGTRDSFPRQSQANRRKKNRRKNR